MALSLSFQSVEKGNAGSSPCLSSKRFYATKACLFWKCSRRWLREKLLPHWLHSTVKFLRLGLTDYDTETDDLHMARSVIFCRQLIHHLFGRHQPICSAKSLHYSHLGKLLRSAYLIGFAWFAPSSCSSSWFKNFKFDYFWAGLQCSGRKCGGSCSCMYNHRIFTKYL